MTRLARITWLLLLSSGLLAVGASAQVDITVTRTVVQRIPIAVVGLRASGGSDLAAQALSVLANDLEFSTVFEVLPPSFMPFNPREVRLGEEEKVLASLNHLKVQAMVVAELTQRGKDLTLEGRVYNVSRGVFLGGKRYFGEVTAIRSMVHRLADEWCCGSPASEGLPRPGSHTRAPTRVRPNST